MQGYSLMLQGLVLALMGLGMVMIYSAQGRVDRAPLHEDFFNTPAGKQIIFAVAGVLLMAIFARVDYRRFMIGKSTFRSVAPWLIVLALVLLAAVYIPHVGMAINGK